MHFNWNKRVLASSFAILSMATSLHAIPRGPCEPKTPDVCCEEPKPGPFAFSYPMDMGLSCPRDFFVHVDGLAFQAKQDGMEFVIQDTNGSSADILYGKVSGFSDNHTDFDFNPGVRVGMGFYLDHDAWCMDFNWTWLNITNYQHVNSTTSGGSLIPLWLLGSTASTITGLGERSSAVWDASYNTLDIRLTKPYHISRYLVFNPHFGIRAGWIDQHYSVDYAVTTAAGIGRVVNHGENDFWGVGTRAGLDTDWVLGKGWSLFGNVAAAMLFGKFDVEQNMNLPNSGEGFDLTSDFYQNVPNFEMALGIAWGRHFNKNKYHVGLKAAYEFHEWFDQLNLRKIFSTASGLYGTDTVSRGNLTLNGFSLRLQLDI